MLQNEYLVAKIGFDTVEIQPSQVGEDLWNLFEKLIEFFMDFDEIFSEFRQIR